MMMVGMYGGDYFKAVRKTFFAETVSMNFVMTGMIPTMVVLADRWEGSMSPLEPSFWFRMSLASIAGGIIAFPVNFWLVRNHLKHGCMTLPGADGPAAGFGHRSPEASDTGGGDMMEMGGDMAHDQRAGGEMEMKKDPDSMGGTPMKEDHDAVSPEPGMTMRELSPGTVFLWIAGTWVMLLAAIWLTSRWVPITFS
ncbi:MAG: DUF4396 domain-containing protein [Pseudomonadota bacterium]|nr:DUF4396 domain-containing protein [Pseudomonadota bacterium]